MSAVDYLRLNGKYLDEARALLAKRNYTQASEKLWGAFAEIVKAVAAKRGITLAHHRSIGEFIDKLQKQNPQLDLISAYSIANSLHINFYEDNLTPVQVKEMAKRIQQTIKTMKRLYFKT